MPDEYEVIVAGAGPAGSLTAAMLARRGHGVLLLDKEKFPRDKICGDALPSGIFDLLAEAGMKEKVEETISKGEFYPLSSMRLVSPGGHQRVYPLRKSKLGFNPCIAPRLYFDDLMRCYAVECGAEFRQLKVEEPLLEDGRVVGVRLQNNDVCTNIRAKIIVGADGVNSVIARHLRSDAGHTDTHRAIALRAYIEEIETNPHEVEFYFNRNILPGYAWIFSLGENRANVGLGMRLDYYRKAKLSLKAMLDRFLSMPEIRKRLKPGWKLRGAAAWPLNFGSQNNLNYAFDGALLVGDAAGLVSPITGGGIHRSLISARLAAETIERALLEGEPFLAKLQRYEQLCDDLILSGLRRIYLLQKALFRFPGLVDFFVKYFSENSSLARAVTK